MIPCKLCIYGGIMVGKSGGTERTFKTADKVVGAVVKTINYEEGDAGCRATFFKSKEEVCINNNFSEFRMPKMGLHSGPPQGYEEINGHLIKSD